jgi:hypothetical protein
MARRGKRPTPPHLRLIQGTHRADRHGPPAAAQEAASRSAEAFGAITRPKGLSRRAGEAWKRFIVPAGWLDASREPAATAFCELWAEFQTAPARFPASRHSQMRAYMSELGLTDARNRAHPAEAPRDEFLD